MKVYGTLVNESDNGVIVERDGTYLHPVINDNFIGVVIGNNDSTYSYRFKELKKLPTLSSMFESEDLNIDWQALYEEREKSLAAVVNEAKEKKSLFSDNGININISFNF